MKDELVPEDRVRIGFSQDEALVLFDWLAGYIAEHDEPDKAPLTAKMWVRGQLEAALERHVNVLFSSRYQEELDEAQSRVQAMWVRSKRIHTTATVR